MTDLANYQHSRRTRRLLRSLAAVVCPPDVSDFGLGERIVDHVELSMRSLPRLARTLLVVGLAVYDVSAMAWPGHLLRPACTLRGDRAERWFVRWRRSPLALQRHLAKGAKGLLCLAYYEMPEVQRHIGYRPDLWISKVRDQRLAEYGAVIRAQADRLTRRDPMAFKGDLV